MKTLRFAYFLFVVFLTPLMSYAAPLNRVNAINTIGIGSNYTQNYWQSGYIFNFRPGVSGNLAHFAAAKSAISSGKRPLLLQVGDSKTMGYNANGSGYTGNAANRITTGLARQLNAAGVPANDNAIFSHQGPSTVAIQAAYDPRITSYTNWSFGSDMSISGNVWQQVSPSTDKLSFYFSDVVDRFTVWYIQRTSGQGYVEAFDASTSLGTQSTNGAAAALVSKTFVLSSREAGKTLSVARASSPTATIRIQGVMAWDSQRPAIDIINVGRFGTKVTKEWVSPSAAWSSTNAIKAMNPDLVVINLTSNDLTSQTITITSMTTSLQEVLNAGASVGASQILVNPTKGQQPTYGTAISQSQITQAIQSLAVSNDIPMIDESGYFGDWNTAKAKGYFSDAIHENINGNLPRILLEAYILGI